MLYIDVKYASLVGHKLRNFKQQDTYHWNFSCPICGDSKKNPRKARGHIKEYKGKLNYKCFNCGFSSSFGTLLKRVDSTLYDEYELENYKESRSKYTPHAKAPEVEKKPVIELTDSAMDSLSRCDTLPITHQSVKYLISRKIPKPLWSNFWHTETFKEFTNSLKNQFDGIQNDHPRLIIPYFTPAGKLFAYQARAYGNETPKYFTIKLDENEEKIYGMDKIEYNKRIYAVEGPIDSMFLDNAIAVSGSTFDIPTIKSLQSNLTLVMDNEPRNKEIVKQFEKYIDKGYTVCIWPDDMPEKDINDMIISGHSKDQIMDLINKNTHQGLSAKLRFNQWRKYK